MSKIKTKKALTPEQKKKRIRNIIIVAVILVAASIATYWMQPQNKALAESEVFSEEEVKKAIECGFTPISLGKSRLRTETAALVACHTMNLLNQ